ncbi:uncharacterized protein BXZ73DRAFT_36246, partial [Epithele typhae]|uniref:uncharacterized protein n=1 Tax=Epithele typhae TaxID=378194 RepID=UPI00200813B0
LIQLRSGHAPLNAHLFRIKRADSALCPACKFAPETVLHYLILCPRWDSLRARHLSPCGRAARKVSALLSDSSLFPALFKFITATGRLSRN